VTQQEARKVRSNLLEYCVHLVVELFDCESIGATACREPKSFKVDQVDVETVERKVDRCLKEHILALSESVDHRKRGMFFMLSYVGYLSAESVHVRFGGSVAGGVVAPKFDFVR
jgi:hypothetical protein